MIGIREGVNKRQGVLAAGAVIVALLSVVFIVVYTLRSNGPTRVSRMFYSTDDGKTWFTDDADKLFPFDHDGQQAYRVDVYKGGDGTEFVGDVERYTDNAKAKLAELKTDPNADPRVVQGLMNSGLEVKHVGDDKWFRVSSVQGQDILNNISSPGGGPVVGVMP
jgi:hypothetical protein